MTPRQRLRTCNALTSGDCLGTMHHSHRLAIAEEAPGTEGQLHLRYAGGRRSRAIRVFEVKSSPGRGWRAASFRGGVHDNIAPAHGCGLAVRVTSYYGGNEYKCVA